MARIRTMANQILLGRVGQNSYYAREGQQVVRQSRNNSNYGEGASRTIAQMTRRVKWSNLVNFYKANLFWMPKAFETIGKGVTVYNKFMSLNINRSVVNFTKNQANSGACVAEPFIVSQGQLPPIAVGLEYIQGFSTDIKLPVGQEQPLTTVGEASAAIVALNPAFLNGDNIGVVCIQSSDDASLMPRVVARYYEFTLDVNSDLLLESVPAVADNILTFNENTKLSAKSDGGTFSFDACTFIHTRKSAGVLKVSTQQLVLLDNTYVERYSTAQSEQEAIDSYGQTQSVPLDPGNSSSGSLRYGIRLTFDPSLPFGWEAGAGFSLIAADGTFDPTRWPIGAVIGEIVSESLSIPILRNAVNPAASGAFIAGVGGLDFEGSLQADNRMILTRIDSAAPTALQVTSVRLWYTLPS